MTTTPAAQSAAMLTELLDELEAIQSGYEMADAKGSARLDVERKECRDKIQALVQSLRAGERQAVATEVQWRNIRHVVKTLADWAFESRTHPQYGSAWMAMVNGLTANDGPKFELEPLPPSPPTSVRHGMEMAADAKAQFFTLWGSRWWTDKKGDKDKAEFWFRKGIETAAAKLPHSPGYVMVPMDKLEYICKLPDSYPVSAIIQMVRAMLRAAQDGGGNG